MQADGCPGRADGRLGQADGCLGEQVGCLGETDGCLSEADGCLSEADGCLEQVDGPPGRSDGRALVVEHKSSREGTTDETKEMRAVGEAWEERSGGQVAFAMTRDADLSEIEAALRRLAA